eukprot:COSAG02_NODE_3886_length_6086_cov_3.247211_2_plen_116_part_00
MLTVSFLKSSRHQPTDERIHGGLTGNVQRDSAESRRKKVPLAVNERTAWRGGDEGNGEEALGGEAMRRLLLSRRRVAAAPPSIASDSESEQSSTDQQSLERSEGSDHEISSTASW